MASSSPGPNRFEILPNEVFLHIFRCLRASTTLSAYIEVLLTCKSFYAVGHSVAFTLLRLQNHNLDLWSTSCLYIGSQYANVQHLTITLNYTYYVNCDCAKSPCDHFFDEESYDSLCEEQCGKQCVKRRGFRLIQHQLRLDERLKSLRGVIARIMRKIVTFVLKVDLECANEPWCICLGTTSHERLFAKVIHALPITCENLFLDTGGSDTFSETPFCQTIHHHGHELCTAIADRMKTLKNIHLRVGSLCPWFFLADHEYLSFDLDSPFHKWAKIEGQLLDQGEIYSYDIQGWRQRVVWKNWNRLKESQRQHFQEVYSQDMSSLRKPRDCEVFVHLQTCIIDYCFAPAMVFHTRRRPLRVAKALSIALRQWQCFPSLVACNILADHTEGLTHDEQNSIEDHSSACFRSFTEMYVMNVCNDSTIALPLRWLFPESKVEPLSYQSKCLYAFHDLTLKNRWFGSLQSFRNVILDSLPGSWHISKSDDMIFPHALIHSVYGLEIQSARDWCISQHEMLRRIARSHDMLYEGDPEDSGCWEDLDECDCSGPLFEDGRYKCFERANNAVADIRYELCDHYGFRDPATGLIATQNYLTIPDDERYLTI